MKKKNTIEALKCNVNSCNKLLLKYEGFNSLDNLEKLKWGGGGGGGGLLIQIN